MSTHHSYKHGKRNDPIYRVWSAQKSRCNNPTNIKYKDYGNRGIQFSEEFEDFSIWYSYVSSLDNAENKGYTLDRIDNSKGYERGNLRWVNMTVQSRNTRLLRSTNKSGFRGVCRASNKKRWRAQIRHNTKVFLGTFDYPWTAAYAYDSYVIVNNLEHTTNFRKKTD